MSLLCCSGLIKEQSPLLTLYEYAQTTSSAPEACVSLDLLPPPFPEALLLQAPPVVAIAMWEEVQ